jgi:hypothetical protein
MSETFPSEGAFALATAVHPAGPDRYDLAIADGWDIAGNTNGGYLLSLAGRAMAAAADRPDPVSVTAHYLAPGRPGPGHVTTSVVRSGRRFSTVEGRLHAAGRDLMAVLGTFGDLTDDSGEQGLHVDGAPPELPAPSTATWSCPPSPSLRRSWAGWSCACTPTMPGSSRADAAADRSCGAGSDCPATSPWTPSDC